MRLYRAYATRRTWLLKTRYVLRFGLELTRAEAGVIARHWLAADELAVSPAGLEADEQAESSLDLAREVDGWNDRAVAKAIGLKTKGIWTALITANREARITVGELVAGRTFEASDAVELMMMVNLIEEAFEALQDKIQVLIAFENSEEQLSENEAEDDGTAPSEWGRFQ